MTSPNSNGKRPASRSPFRDAVLTGMASRSEEPELPEGMQLGENGSPEFNDAGLGSDILAISQMVRGGDPRSLCDAILKRDSTRDVSDLIILLFVTRNARGGKGEKDLSFQIFLRVWMQYPATAKQLLGLFAHYGYWKDLLLLAVSAKAEEVNGSDAILDESIALMKTQLQKDETAVNKYNSDLAEASSPEEKAKLQKKGPAISLLAKWLPREGTHFDKKLGFVGKFTQATPSSCEDKPWQSKSKAAYRKLVVKLTAFLELPEVLLSAKRDDEINFGKLASKATFRLSRALLNETKSGGVRSEDPKRIRLAELFVDHMAKHGLKGGQVMPHEIVREIMKGNVSRMRETVLDAQWKDMWKRVVDDVRANAKEEGLEFDPTKMVPLSDVSGSMSGVPMEVSIALGIGISEITHPAFQDMVLTFESEPRWHKLNAGDSIVQKVRSLGNAPWGGSTNFEGAYDEILKVCRESRLRREDCPVLIVFSDMQFNEAAGFGYSYYGSNGTRSRAATMHNVICEKFATTAKALGWEDVDPTPIVYWNLRNTGGHPVEKDTAGSVLLSGFSPSLLKLVMNGEALKEEVVEVVEKDGTVRQEKVRVTPEEVLRKMLDDSLYDPVRLVLAASKEKALGDYEPPTSVLESAPMADGFELV
ncbi:Domain of unknown function (DUF2828) [Seminavis robusta]|uniref:Uncharacterized protein n=1 Tax=Seminavis robusta TaxID=568900 RepID=A0A9N8H2L4_9STRA|nr:Domain of unknown function (DUF2828) [Seminavis robusta]|eukprot:Sro39_g024060.1 Domain of unknown function (DUF2828) (647) ;mRNA; r:49370-51310